MGFSGLALTRGPWRPAVGATCLLINGTLIDCRKERPPKPNLRIRSGWLSPGTMATQTTEHLSIKFLRAARMGDPPPHYEHVDYESTFIDCRKIHTSPRLGIPTEHVLAHRGGRQLRIIGRGR